MPRTGARGAIPGSRRDRALRVERWVPLVYAAFAVAWVALSDLALARVSRSVTEHTAWSFAKGLAFVALTTLVLHAALRWALTRERRAHAERDRAADALRESEERLALALDAAELGTWHVAPPGALVASPRSRAILGLAPGAEVPDFDAYLAMVHPDDRDAVRAAAMRWFDPAGGDAYHQEYRCLRPDGTVRWLSVHGKVRRGASGHPDRVDGTIRDITDVKALQAQLMQSDRLASVGMLAAGVAHEINNPLAYLIAALDFLDAELKEVGRVLPPDSREELTQALAEARDGASRVRHVVRDVKTFSGMQEERRARIELPPIVDSAINMAANEIKYRARLVREYGAAPAVLANDARLGQVFLNLLVNAAHAISEGRVGENEIRVIIGTDSHGRAVVEIRDTGPGIRPQVLERIFDPFFTTKPTGVGTGLGLSICRGIVTALGGDITVDTRLGAGTTFRVALPAAPEGCAAEPPPRPAPVAAGRRGRVLVVDDEAMIGAAIRRVLAAEHDVEVLTSAAEARDRVARGDRFDAIVCDLMMPQMTGMELHAELERIDPDQARRVVVLTGGAFTAGADDFLARVANPRLEKPFDPIRLRSVVRTVVA